MADANDGNGRGTIQKIWDKLSGIEVTVARIEERQTNMHEGMEKMQTDVDTLKSESQRRTGARNFGKGLWAAAIAILMLAVAVLGLMYSARNEPVTERVDLTIEANK